ncbi:YpjP family protein [Aquibacillus koreensis]|uniref:YpjP family protein n=1 Tax=Aquibacillus koreensis TaxID=279446 RepID=A0A9X4AK96_9BACI|nr:YpjP family protein [Aquibacillus koreensis]MCT2537804.1 YpjP family protein [Aquibacillus koreensis]MDC3421163.1 YpjP family protein [Aquibacillus koreensis]
MKLVLRKLFVILIAFMTLGLYIPPIYLNANAESKEVFNADEGLLDESSTPNEDSNIDSEVSVQTEVVLPTNETIVDGIIEQAKGQTVTKLGPRIMDQIEDEFTSVVLPAMESVIRTVLSDAEESGLYFYEITEQPTQGYGEQIFNIINYQTKTDIARFHVRRDKRPQEGYWFNFHYHLSEDNYEEHHTIGEIYWDKNTPPKWMS